MSCLPPVEPVRTQQEEGAPGKNNNKRTYDELHAAAGLAQMISSREEVVDENGTQSNDHTDSSEGEEKQKRTTEETETATLTRVAKKGRKPEKSHQRPSKTEEHGRHSYIMAPSAPQFQPMINGGGRFTSHPIGNLSHPNPMMLTNVYSSQPIPEGVMVETGNLRHSMVANRRARGHQGLLINTNHPFPLRHQSQQFLGTAPSHDMSYIYGPQEVASLALNASIHNIPFRDEPSTSGGPSHMQEMFVEILPRPEKMDFGSATKRTSLLTSIGGSLESERATMTCETVSESRDAVEDDDDSNGLTSQRRYSWRCRLCGKQDPGVSGALATTPSFSFTAPHDTTKHTFLAKKIREHAARQDHRPEWNFAYTQGFFPKRQEEGTSTLAAAAADYLLFTSSSKFTYQDFREWVPMPLDHLSLFGYIRYRFGTIHGLIHGGVQMTTIKKKNKRYKVDVDEILRFLKGHRLCMERAIQNNWEKICVTDRELLYRIIQDVFVGNDYRTSLVYEPPLNQASSMKAAGTLPRTNMPTTATI